MEGLISTSTMKAIEFVFLFGLVFGFCFWQLRALKKLERERLAREREEAARTNDGSAEDASATTAPR
jgi:hypothetical protein